MARRTRFDLIQEAAATAAEKTAKPAAPKKSAAAKSPKSPKSPKGGGPKSNAARSGGGRMKAVWVVLDPSFDSVATFEYRDRALAEQKAQDLTEQKGRPYVVHPDRVAMDPIDP